MKGAQKRDLIEIINKSTEDLHQKIDMHRYLMATIVDKKISEKRLNEIINPVFNRIMETIVSEEGIRNAKKYAKEATQRIIS